MGASLGGSTGGSRRRGRRRRSGAAGLSEINITPFVDVMLVLLIIFMVAAPLMTVSVPIDLPQASAKALQQDKPPITVSVKENGDIFLMDTQVKSDELVAKLKAIAQNGADERVFVRGDSKANYQSIMDVLSTIKNGGYTKVALVATERAGR